MCKFLLDLLKPPKIPFPEEPMHPLATVGTVSVMEVLNRWMSDYEVPLPHRSWWLSKIVIMLDPELAYPACTWEENSVRYMKVRPEWLNPGVIAHEQAHNSYALLTEQLKLDFAATFETEKYSSRLLKVLFKTNTYGLTSAVEGHAEVYRYCGQSMPVALKPYYPKLID